MANPDLRFIESEPALSLNEPIEILHAKHNKSAPLLRLPLELLLFVLHLVIADDEEAVTQKRVVTLLSVCSGLRALVTAVPEFWTYASLSWPEFQVRRVVALSRPGSLRFVVPVDWHKPWTGAGWNPYSAASRPKELIAAFPHVTHLKMTCNGKRHAMQEGWSYCLEEIHSSALRTLELAHNSIYQWSFILQARHWHESWRTHLTTLSLEGLKLHLSIPQLPSLRTLKLINTILSGKELHEFLLCTPTLEDIVLLHTLDFTDEDYPSNLPTISLPHLQNLTLHGLMYWIAPLLAALPDPRVMLKVDAFTGMDSLEEGRSVFARCKTPFRSSLELGVTVYDILDRLTLEGPLACVSFRYIVRSIDPLFALVDEVIIGPYGVRGDVLHAANFLPNARRLGLYPVDSEKLAKIVAWIKGRAKRFDNIDFIECTDEERARLSKALEGAGEYEGTAGSEGEIMQE
jgi:hypothetical protein